MNDITDMNHKKDMKELNLKENEKEEIYHCNEWDINSWKKYNISQQPKYESENDLEKILSEISLKNISSVEQIVSLKQELSNENNFTLIMGDCAEPFIDNEKSISYSKCSFISLIGELLKEKLNKNVILLARMAGQFAKPRSSEFEVINSSKYILLQNLLFLLKGKL